MTPAADRAKFNTSPGPPTVLHDMEVEMAKFMDIHNGFVGVTAEQLREAHERDLAIEREEGVHFERAWLDPEAGKVFCLSSGPTKEAIQRVHERAGHPTAEVYELAVEVA
jgi:hypothetical protein